MNIPQNGRHDDWIEGDAIPPNELVIRYGIPREEIASFHQYIRIYTYGAVIIQEDDTDKLLFLLRSGSVAIFKNTGDIQQQIATIDAVNFVGEMSLINDEPRTATVKVLSDQALVYVMARPNISGIVSNPKWAEMLITRFSKNLSQNNTQLVAMTQIIKELKAEITRLRLEMFQQRSENQRLLARIALAFNAILYFENVVMGLAVVGSKGWAYLKALSDVSKAMVAHYWPGVHVSAEAAEAQVLQDCVKSIQSSGTSSIYETLSESL
jgi:CRP/FNR family transcriptional regulator, cyclic AMP receptor protein